MICKHVYIINTLGVKMQVGEKIIFDKYRWSVLDIHNDSALIVTDEIIEQRAYHNTYKDTTWCACERRRYLNSEFYDRFDADNKSRILEVTNKNMDNTWYGTNAGEESRDKIFFLSLEEICKYFGDSTDKLYNRGNNRYWKKNDENNRNRLAKAVFVETCWWWWLRSPGRHNRLAAYVHGTDGCVGVNGNNITNASGGIRPALWMKL
jgi:hypothetical protein